MTYITFEYIRYIKNTGQNDGTPGLDLNVTHVWKRGITGKGVTVAILDDGVDYLHPDLGNRFLFGGQTIGEICMKDSVSELRFL